MAQKNKERFPHNEARDLIRNIEDLQAKGLLGTNHIGDMSYMDEVMLQDNLKQDKLDWTSKLIVLDDKEIVKDQELVSVEDDFALKQVRA